jgi:hypothetical protein
MIVPLSTPSSVILQTTEELPLGMDMTALLSGSETPSNPVVVMEDLTAGTNVTLPTAPVLSGNVVVQVVSGSLLTPQHQYRMLFSFQAATDTTWTVPLAVVCPF